jgi:hypothetical protein
VIIKLFLEIAEFFRDYYLLEMSKFKENYKGGQNMKSVGNSPKELLASGQSTIA